MRRIELSRTITDSAALGYGTPLGIITDDDTLLPVPLPCAPAHITGSIRTA